jgi:hypothetical protein
MAKTSKKSKETAVTQGGPASVPSSTNNSDKDMSIGSATGKASGRKSSKTAGQPKAAAKRATRPAGKTLRARKPRTVTPAGTGNHSRRLEISDDDIRLRAYFIAERRLQSGMAGDSTNDWWEAHRQLQEEASKNN